MFNRKVRSKFNVLKKVNIDCKIIKEMIKGDSLKLVARSMQEIIESE